MYGELHSPHDVAAPQDLVHCTAMLAHMEQSTAKKLLALRTLIYAAALVVFALLNPLACVWHCALQDHLAEHAQRYVWLCSAHQQHAAGDVIVDGAAVASLSGGATIAAVHHGIVTTAIGMVPVLLVVLLERSFVLMRRVSVAIVPLPPPPKHTPRYT